MMFRSFRPIVLVLGPRGGDGAGGNSLRVAFQTADSSQATERPLAARHRISNVVSKKVCVLEIDLEITKALPDKAHKRKRVCISKSPDIFAPGDGTRLRTMPLYDCRAYADAAVGIFVGIYETPSLDWHIQPCDMNSVGGPYPQGFRPPRRNALATESASGARRAQTDRARDHDARRTGASPPRRLTSTHFQFGSCFN